MSDHSRRLGRLARIFGQVRAGGAPWEIEVQSALLEDGAPQTGDEALLDRLISQVTAESAALSTSAAPAALPSRRRPHRAVSYALAATLAFAALAAAATGVQMMVKRSTLASPSAADVAAVPASGQRRASPSVAPVPAVSPDRPPSSAAEPAPLSHSSAPPRDPASNPETAATLYATAKQAQRAGQRSLAVSKFQSLQGQFAQSPEAQVSRIVLGSLFMSSGNAAGALLEYDAYLKRGGAMSEEALVGRARALGALGRAPDEASAWQALLAQYPRSVHGELARNRLARLRGQR